MSSAVQYLLSGPAHLPYLIVSLYTLRQHYQGPIRVAAYEQSYDIVRQIAADKRLGIEPEAWIPTYTGKNSQFLNKILLCQRRNYELRVYLDADVSVHGSIEPLFQLADNHSMVATQFNQWTSTGGTIARRIGALLKFPKIPRDAVQELLNNGHKYPSPNGGIFAVHSDSPVLPKWFEYSWEAKSVFICDEAVLHILQLLFTESDYYIHLGGRFNCSWKWQHEVEQPVIRHFHGNSAVRRNKYPEAVEFWYSLYRECLEENIGFVQDWKHQIENRWMIGNEALEEVAEVKP